jgi:hypothetical protein
MKLQKDRQFLIARQGSIFAGEGEGGDIVFYNSINLDYIQKIEKTNASMRVLDFTYMHETDMLLVTTDEPEV